jgi:hypothetical protein
MGGACGMQGEKRNAYRTLMGEPEGKRHYKDPDTSGKIILKWVSQR